MEDPIRYEDLQDIKLKFKFARMFSAISELVLLVVFGRDADEAALKASCRGALHKQIRLEVATNPTLSRIVTPAGNCPLLCHVCSSSLDEWIHPTVKLLIESNPAVLLWEPNHNNMTISMIAGHRTHCVLY